MISLLYITYINHIITIEFPITNLGQAAARMRVLHEAVVIEIFDGESTRNGGFNGGLMGFNGDVWPFRG